LFPCGVRCSFLLFLCFLSCRPTFDAAKPSIATGSGKASTKSKTKKATKQQQQQQEEEQTVDDAKYVGCYGSENAFLDKVYSGGSTGANYGLALHHAKTSKKRYFAIARGGGDGHSFAFSSLDTNKQQFKGDSGGCERPCADVEDKACGCIDMACTGPKPKGEEHNRRWAVYEVVGNRK
jgi:dolichyl-diphosphooligosaccharide--protein glycosyltransferase